MKGRLFPQSVAEMLGDANRREREEAAKAPPPQAPPPTSRQVARRRKREAAKVLRSVIAERKLKKKGKRDAPDNGR